MRANSVNDTLAARYSQLYSGGMKHDSPEVSRIRMGKSILEYLLNSDVKYPVVLDIGSGPQMLERQLFARGNDPRMKYVRERLAQTVFVTLDIAKLPKLFASSHCKHVRADSGALPFMSGSVDLVISNHSIDMLRTSQERFMHALYEVERVLKPDGLALFYYHTAELYEQNTIEGAIAQRHSAFYYDTEDICPFYDDPNEIRQDLIDAGLLPKGIGYIDDGPDNWWEVHAKKPEAQSYSGLDN